MLNLGAGFRGVPGALTDAEARALQWAVRLAPAGSAVVLLETWCGRSLAAAAEVLPSTVALFSFDLCPAEPPRAHSRAEAQTMVRKLVLYHAAKGRQLAHHALGPAEAAHLYQGPPVTVIHAERFDSLEPWRRLFAPGCKVLTGAATAATR